MEVEGSYGATREKLSVFSNYILMSVLCAKFFFFCALSDSAICFNCCNLILSMKVCSFEKVDDILNL